MSHRTSNALVSAWTWLVCRPGFMLLSASDARLAAEPPQRFRTAWISVMVASLIWGVALLNVWGVAWKVFRDYDPLVMPAMSTAALFGLWAFRRGVAALADFLGGTDPTARTVAAAAVVVVVAFSLMGLKPDWHRWELTRLPWWVSWLHPQAKLYRVLLLMPLWGGWGMLILGKFCQPTERTEPQVAALTRGCGAIAAAACMAVLMLVSVTYFHHLGTGSQAIIFAATVLTAIVGGSVFCRLAGGLNRKVLLAANVATQIAFLLSYLAGR